MLSKETNAFIRNIGLRPETIRALSDMRYSDDVEMLVKIAFARGRTAAVSTPTSGATRLIAAMRTTTSIVSLPSGADGAKIVVEMDEETSLYDILSAAWDEARAAVAHKEA
ncbi:hypothetical protein PMI01_02200 [Caulobacter sp. AP07]|uniref:hypothetical protein n=1 Tax=Caulobacter sp. AP07 TaxID=1144304 RepID=UPI0002722027|nr:hypothetical protein [Caulobacter sp. AP07]EJL33238.1 hypothetical protein PMI01_02200 [Caulobacter sp. AP07]